MTRLLQYGLGGVIFLLSLILCLDYFWPVDLASRDQSRVVLAEDGSVLRAFADRQGVWRYPVSLNAVSSNYIEALVGYEDQYFFQHPGVNPIALMRAGWQWLRNGEIVSGGSTLTMQVARIRYPQYAKRSIYAKLMQILRALQLEAHYSKSDILNYYVNHAPFGGTLEGVQTASMNYFGYGAESLTDAQAALLAILPQAPSYYRPDRHPERALQARNKLMQRLVEQGVWNAARFDDAIIERVSVLPLEHAMHAPLLARRLANLSQSAKIETYINPRWQRAVEGLVKRHVSGIGRHVSAATLVVENTTGKVKAYVGSADFSSTERFGFVDMNQAIRSPGSTLKPFIYGLALDDGLIHSESLLMDVPLSFGDYRPENFNGGFRGPVAVSDALRSSLNMPAVQVLEQLGAARLYLAFSEADLPMFLPDGARPNLSIALGGTGMRLEDIVSAYTAFGNQGKRQSLRYQVSDPSQTKTMLSEGAAWIIRNVMKGDQNMAIKTGTSYGYRDAWAIAVTGQYTVGVWIGRPDNLPVTGHYGRVTAVPLLRQVTRLLGGSSGMLEAKPISVTQKDICWPQGFASDICDEHRSAWVLDNTMPITWYSTRQKEQAFVSPSIDLTLSQDLGLRVPVTCNLPSGIGTYTFNTSVWPAPLEPWLAAEFRRESRIPALDPRCQLNGEPPLQAGLSLQGIESGQRFTQDGKLTLKLGVSGGEGPFFWYLDGVLQPISDRSWHFVPPLGSHQLVVADRKGQVESRHFDVQASH